MELSSAHPHADVQFDKLRSASPMITSRLPPTRFFGSVTTTLSCPAFACFVSTSRRLFVSAYWETAFFEVSPTNDSDMRLRLRFGYPCKLQRRGVEILHDMCCSKLDKIAETTHEPLSDCLKPLIAELRENNVISWIMVY
jgi:hypothetical protein